MAQRRCYGCMKTIGEEKVCPHCGFDGAPNEVHQLPIGIVLHERYFIGRVLGQGGFGITYIGWDARNNIPVAIKEFFPSGMVHRQTSTGLSVTSYLGESTQSFDRNKTRFVKEANSLAQMRGLPEIVQVMDFFQENNTAYIVMEYVEGITLKKFIKQHKTRPDPNEILTLLKPLLPALHDVHQMHLIHRDISPDNIMLPAKGGIKLIDFGTVRYMDDTNLSKSTEAILKPGFAPMEQYQNHGRLGPWTDVYALCGTIYYCLTGKVPQDAPSRMVEESRLEIEKVIPNIDKRISNALEAGMAIRAENRLQSVDDLYEMLYGSGKAPENTIIRPTQPQETVVQVQTASGNNVGAASGKQKESAEKKIKWLPIVSIAAAACCIVLFLFALSSEKSSAGKEKEDTPVESTQEYIQMAFDGWVSSGGYRYYYVDGKPLVGWHTIDGQEYYFDEDGVAAIGRTVLIGEDSYYFDVYGKVKSITYAALDATQGSSPFRFRTTTGAVRDVVYQQLAEPVTDCVGFDFSVNPQVLLGTLHDERWSVCVRINGEWTSCATLEVGSDGKSQRIAFSTPCTFDAYMAYRLDSNALDASCDYEITNVEVSCP